MQSQTLCQRWDGKCNKTIWKLEKLCVCKSHLVNYYEKEIGSYFLHWNFDKNQREVWHYCTNFSIKFGNMKKNPWNICLSKIVVINVSTRLKQIASQDLCAQNANCSRNNTISLNWNDDEKSWFAVFNRVFGFPLDFDENWWSYSTRVRNENFS